MLEFKGKKYSYLTLKDYIISQNKRYSGEVVDLETGESFGIEELYPKDFKVKWTKDAFHNECKEAGIDVTVDVLKDLGKEENKELWKRIKYLIENNPNKLTSSELERYMEHEGIKPKKMMGFNSYHQMNDELEANLIERDINPSSYRYFRYLLIKYCSLSYTLQYKNNKRIVTNKQIADVLNITPRTWRDHKKELKKFNLIREIKFENNEYIKINPCFVSKRKMMTPNTYYAFRNDLIRYKMISKLQALYWDRVLIEDYDIDILNKINS